MASPSNTTTNPIINRFPHALGIALLPDRETHDNVLAVTNAAFSTVPALNGIMLSAEKVPHVSVFQNMFRDPEEVIRIVQSALASYPLAKEYLLQSAPNEICVWANNRPFINHEVTDNLARFHDTLLVQCIMNGKGQLCAGAPADSRPLEGLTTEQDRAYRETGYVFSGAGSEIAERAGVPWRAFTMPHFTAGVLDVAAVAHGIEDRVLGSMREEMNRRSFTICRFDRIEIFRVKPGGVYVPSEGTTVWSHPLY